MDRPTCLAGSLVGTVAVLVALVATLATPVSATVSAPPPPPGSEPVEVFMKGENITGWNPANDTRNYYCFRIPQLLALPSGTILAFAEGRADGCRPDGNRNRPIVVRASKDLGKTWGPIGIAGPALPTSSTNYPGAFLRDSKTIALRYCTDHGVSETTSTDEGSSWSQAANASQPECGSAWPKMVGTDVVMACRGGSARSSDGGLTWKMSTKGITYNGTNVTGGGEMMPVADGRTPTSLTMMIRAGSHSSMLNHAIAQSDDFGDTWGDARLLPIVGTTCEGSIGRDATAPPGHVLLAATDGRNKYRLGRGNMSVFTLDESVAGSEPVSALDVWPDAAGYSDFAQVEGGPVLLLFEGGGGTYDYGIKIKAITV